MDLLSKIFLHPTCPLKARYQKFFQALSFGVAIKNYFQDCHSWAHHWNFFYAPFFSWRSIPENFSSPPLCLPSKLCPKPPTMGSPSKIFLRLTFHLKARYQKFFQALPSGFAIENFFPDRHPWAHHRKFSISHFSPEGSLREIFPNPPLWVCHRKFFRVTHPWARHRKFLQILPFFYVRHRKFSYSITFPR